MVGPSLPVDGESTAVSRLVSGIAIREYRDILTRCLSGSVAPAVALTQLFDERKDQVKVRSMIDEITMRAASLSRATDSLLRDRVDELTQLVVNWDGVSFVHPKNDNA